MLVRLCDWCKEQIPEDGHFFNLTVSRDDFKSDKVEEICQGCYDAFRNRVRMHVESKKKEEEPKRKGPAPKPIDMGKVKALKRAGWSLGKIADEIGISAPTICKALKKEAEKEVHVNAD